MSEAGTSLCQRRTALLVWALVVLLSIGLAAPVSAQDVADRGQASLGWLNAFRADQGRAPLRVSPRLSVMAAGHAKDMARKGFFSHTGSNGSTIGDRARQGGYRFCFIAENIAKGPRSVENVLQGWAGSAGHRKNMLARGAAEVAVVEGPNRIWVMVLGRDGC